MNVRLITWNKPREPTEKELREAMAKDGMKPYISVMEKGEFVGPHAHSYNESRIMLSGIVEFCAEGRTFVLKPGDRIDLQKGTTHTAKNLYRGQSAMLCATNNAQKVYLEFY